MSRSPVEISVFESLESRRLLSVASPGSVDDAAEPLCAPVVQRKESVVGKSANAVVVDKAVKLSTAWSNRGQNAYFPLVPGYKWEYSNGGNYKVYRAITSQTKVIANVSTRVMTEVHYYNGKKVESWKWFLAIRKSSGRVGFFGEEYTGADISWLTDYWYAGENGNPIGTLLPGKLIQGSKYIREAASSEVDVDCTIQSVTAKVTAGGKTYKNCIQVLNNTFLDDWSTTYAKGVGEIANTFYGVKLTKFTKK